jgi:hypothetical protein
MADAYEIVESCFELVRQSAVSASKSGGSPMMRMHSVFGAFNNLLAAIKKLEKISPHVAKDLEKRTLDFIVALKRSISRGEQKPEAEVIMWVARMKQRLGVPVGDRA